ncbi:Lrp/AsnC family transcriptional regulator [Chloroflexota bacterium]
MIELDAVDRALLEPMQAAFPLSSRPYRDLGLLEGLEENDVLVRVRRLKREGFIRQIGAIFDTRRLGYHSTLAAFHVSAASLEGVAGQISAHPGVSHNYARPHHYNLWFTLAVPPQIKAEEEIERLACRAKVSDWLNLPALRVFKIRTHFQLREHIGRGATDVPLASGGSDQRQVTEDDIIYIRALQTDLPVLPQPFAETAGRFGLDEGELLERSRQLETAGIMRRYSAVLRHRRVGYTSNGMGCWAVPESQIEEAGRFAAGLSQVSHCYQRPAFPPRWPYTLFTMIHGQTSADVETIVARIARETGVEEYQVLYSTREFKKERVRYFEEER